MDLALPESGDQIIDEYIAAARVLSPVADYLMLNLSCPNTEDGRDFFADAGHLRAFLTALGELQLSVPVFLKVSPLGGIATIERVLGAVEDHAYISGFMFNLPPVKPDGLKTPERIWRAMPGAVSGPRRPRSPIPASAKRSVAWTASVTPRNSGPHSSFAAGCTPGIVTIGQSHPAAAAPVAAGIHAELSAF